jgi:hypothetical protein
VWCLQLEDQEMCPGKEYLPKIHRNVHSWHVVHASHTCKCLSTNHRCDSHSNTVISAALSWPFALKTKYPSTHIYTDIFRCSLAPNTLPQWWWGFRNHYVCFIFFVDYNARNTENFVKYTNGHVTKLLRINILRQHLLSKTQYLSPIPFTLVSRYLI